MVTSLVAHNPATTYWLIAELSPGPLKFRFFSAWNVDPDK